jgi:hypothetical protein
MGPMTGRAAGYCAGYGVPGFTNSFGGRGFGFGFGRGGGWGRRNWFHATGLTGWQRGAYAYPAWGGAAPAYFGAVAPQMPYGAPSREQELQALQRQAEYLDDALGGIRKRIAEIEAEGEKQK